MEEDLDSARVSGHTLSSVTYIDSDEGDGAIPDDGTVTLVKDADNHVTVVNTYCTPSSPSLDPTPDPDDPNVGIPDEEVPLANVPKTGDGSGLWYVMALLSGCGLAVLNLLKKREK